MPDPATPKPWALLAYTVADDKGGGDAIDAALKKEIVAICDAAALGDVDVAAQVDFKFTQGVYRAALKKQGVGERDFDDISPEDQPLWREVAARLEEAGLAEQVRLKVQRERRDLNAANGEVLADFFEFGVKECPAERYVFFMYGHASGPMGLFYDRESSKHVPNTMRLNDMADAVRSVDGRAAVAIFRDCYMSNLEAAYEFREATEFMIASQSVVPITGVWPWRDLLPRLLPQATGEVAASLANAIGKFLDVQENRGAFADAPLSLLDLGAAALIVEPLTALSAALDYARWDPERRDACARAIDAARIGHSDTHSDPGDPGLVDVLTMCDNLARLGSDPVVAPANALVEVVRSRLVKSIHTQGKSYRGVSLYCKATSGKDLRRSIMQAEDPDEAAKDALAYSRLSLSTATGWYRIALNPLIASGR